MFLFGALIGAVVATMSMTLLAAIVIEEKEKQIDYFKKQLQEQAETMKDDEYKYFNVNPIDTIICLKNFRMKGD